MASAAERQYYRDILKMDNELKKTKDALAASVRESIRRSMVMTEFKIGYNVRAAALKRFFMRRYRHMIGLCGTRVSGRPVCPPDLSFFDATITTPEGCSRFHIVQIVHPDRGDGVQLLFKECNFYFVAFRPVDKQGNGHIWFRFHDELLPSHMESCEIGYSSSYSKLDDVTIGHEGLRSIYDALSQYTPQNARIRSKERKQALRCAAFMLSEAQRFPCIQSLVLDSVLSEVKRVINDDMIRLVRSWGNFSRDDCARVVAEYQRIVSETDEQNRKKSKDHAKSSKQPVYRGYHRMLHKVHVYMFDQHETPKVIVWQERAKAAMAKARAA